MTRSLAARRTAATLLALVAVGGLTACSSGGDNTAASSPSDSTSATPTESASLTESTSPSVVTGTATDFCGAFKDLEDVQGDGATTPAEVAAIGAKFRAAAADMNRFAPAEIKDAVQTYAAVIDAIGQAAMGGTIDDATLSAKLQEGLSEHPEDLSTVALWVAKNCPL